MSPDAAVLRHLTLLVGAAVLIDTTFFAVLAPLLPGFSHSLHLSKLGAGVLTASYAAGMLVASIPAGVLAVRMGPRFAVCAGLGLLFVSTVAFALLHSAPALDLARFVEGIGGACSWDGGLAWLVGLAPAERRGSAIGKAVSAAIAGAVAGPGVGALASVTGRPALFIGLATLALGLAVACWWLPIPAGGATAGAATTGEGTAGLAARDALTLMRRPLGLAAVWFMCLPAIVSGTLTVLGSLQLHHLGASAGIIGATFIAAAGLETLISTWAGGVSDRHGRLAPLIGSFAVAGVALACFSAPASVAVLVIVIAGTGAAIGAAWTPAMALFSDLAEAVGLDQALGAGVMNAAWALGQIIGSGGSGALARVTDNTVTTLLLAGFCLLSAGVLFARQSSIDQPVAGSAAG